MLLLSNLRPQRIGLIQISDGPATIQVKRNQRRRVGALLVQQRQLAHRDVGKFDAPTEAEGA